MEILNRSMAEDQIKESIDDFLSVDILQDILNLIFGEDFMVVEDEGEINVEDEV
jgi:hypothetical protein